MEGGKSGVGTSGDVVEVPGTADAKAEALFAHEGAAAVADGCGCGVGAVPVEGGGEFLGVGFLDCLEVVDRAGGDGEVGGFGTALRATGKLISAFG